MHFTCRTEIIDKTMVLFFEGRILDISSADDLMIEVDKEIENGIKKFIVDFSKIDYINSSGLGLLINLLNKVRNNYGELYICSMPAKVKALVTTSKLDHIFNIEDSLESALQKTKA